MLRWHSSTLSTVLLVACVLGLAISNDSLWIDEALTALKAARPSFARWIAAMGEDRGSDLQMPLYMFVLWCWEKIGGSGEWWLRFANAPLFLLGFVPFCRNRIALAVVTAASGFVWYYLNEARPYAMQVGATLLLFASSRAFFSDKTDPNQTAALQPRMAFALGLILLSGSSLLGMIWAGAAVFAVALALPFSRWRIEASSCRALWALTGAALTVIAGYYVWTLMAGARATAIASTDFRNVIYALYELLGFAGLGPGRFEIRYGGFQVFLRFVGPLALYAALVLVIALAGLRTLARETPRRIFIAVSISVAAASIFLCLVGYKTHFRVLGRHLTPAIVVWLVVAATGIEMLWRRGGVSRAVVVTFVLLSFISGLQLRWAARHTKDDYRSAAAVAKAGVTAGKNIWWSADEIAAAYYRVPGSGNVSFAVNKSAADLLLLPEPHLVIASKPEIFDYGGALAKYLAERQYRPATNLPAFTIWEINR